MKIFLSHSTRRNEDWAGILAVRGQWHLLNSWQSWLGKSTSMKYLSHHPLTRDYLERWSESKQLVLASFYLWNSGTDLQKSWEDLLRSLVFEINRQCPLLLQYALTASSKLDRGRKWEDESGILYDRKWTEGKMLLCTATPCTLMPSWERSSISQLS